MTLAQRVCQQFSTGKPPASEFRTPSESVHAASLLLKALKSAMGDLQHEDDVRVAIGYVDQFLTTLTMTRVVPGQERKKIEELSGQPIIILGLAFAIVDREREDEKTGEPIGLAGIKPFLFLPQVIGWFEELKRQALEGGI